MNPQFVVSTQSAVRDKNIVITGASDGIGRVAAERLAAMGANVLIVGRNAQKTEAVVRGIGKATLPGAVSFEIADLSLQRDVHALATRVHAQMPRIDVLLNNAGAIFAERSLTSEGFERTFALNHLSYFSLTLLLLPALYAATSTMNPVGGSNPAAARVINVASRAHVRARLDFGDLQSERSFRGWRTYNNTKLENILFTRALSRRLDTNRVVTHALHPGVVASQFAVAGNGWWGRFMRAVMNLNSITPERGSDTMVHLAVATDAIASSGLYWDKCVSVMPSVAAQNADDAERLWSVSAALTGLDADGIALNARTP